MHVLIRPESTQDRPDLMDMLKYTTIRMINILHNNGIDLPDNYISIWVKHFSGDKYYPKIEFDYEREELQYDISHDGEIQEVHFKEFQKTPYGTRRMNITKDHAVDLLKRIDDIIQANMIENQDD